uniref:Uncharacterized protein n=1 Tax=Rhizophora mucronata TaxID=61149 RepID=A0A2P2PYP0_RHIMU
MQVASNYRFSVKLSNLFKGRESVEFTVHFMALVIFACADFVCALDRPGSHYSGT